MERLTDISTIREILGRHGFTFSKALGQNFLINPSVCPRMAEAAVESINDSRTATALQGEEKGTRAVIEIGPGIGVLTKELLQRADKVVAVELDQRLLPVLDETLGTFDNLKVINADVLELDLHRLIREEFDGMDVVVCANLPYYITSPVIMKLLEDRLPIRSITVMVQKEAAERLCAEPGTRDSSAITAAVRYYCDPELLFRVSAGSFMPAPKVDSAVIRLSLHEPTVHPENEKTFFKVIKAGFGQRRKTLSNALSVLKGYDKATILRCLEEAGIDPVRRGETLSLEEYARLSDVLRSAI